MAPPPALLPYPPARPLTTSCACAVRQEALLPYFGSPAELLAAGQAMHQGCVVAYREKVSGSAEKNTPEL
jgi:hypothetical protein